MEGLETEPGTLRDNEALGARRAAPARDIRGLAEGFLIVDGTGILDRFPYGSPAGCITERRLESITVALRESCTVRARRECVNANNQEQNQQISWSRD